MKVLGKVLPKGLFQDGGNKTSTVGDFTWSM